MSAKSLGTIAMIYPIDEHMEILYERNMSKPKGKSDVCLESL